MYPIPDYGNTESTMIQGGDINTHSNTLARGQSENMNTDQAPEFLVDAGMYFPPATNYAYYCPGGEWDDHLRVFGVDGPDMYTVAQAENMPYLYYTPSYGYGDSTFNPYNPYIPGAIMRVDGSYVGGQGYYNVSPYQNQVSSSGYIPVLVQSRPEVTACSSTEPLIDTGSSSANRISASGVKNTNAASSRFSVTPGKPASTHTNSLIRTSESATVNAGTSKPPVTQKTNTGRNYGASSFLPQGGSSSVSSPIMDNISQGKISPGPTEENLHLAVGGFFPEYGSNAAEQAAVDGTWPKFYYSKGLNDINWGSNTLVEQNRGPRTDKSKTKFVIKAYSTRAGEIDSQGNIVISTNEYNKDDFGVDYSNAKFFVIKSYSEDDVHKSIKYKVWSSTTNGNKKLNSAYEDTQQVASGYQNGCPVFLYFSVNASGQFCGVAEMVGGVDFNKDMDFWQQDKWSGSFPVRWHIIKDVPNTNFRHIILENNEHRPVTNSRDTQEIMYNQGMEMLKIFKSYISRTSLLDDFMYYEDRQKHMLQERARFFRKPNNPTFTPFGKVNDVGVREERLTDAHLKYHSGSGRITESITEQRSRKSDVSVQDGPLSTLKIGSLSINPKTDQRVSVGDTSVSSGLTRLGSGTADNFVTVGSVPVKVNALDRSSGVLTVGSIPLDPKRLEPEKRSVSEKGGSKK